MGNPTKGIRYLLSTLKGDFGGKRNGNEVLVRVDKRVSDGDEGGVVESQRDGGNRLDATHEAINELRLINIKNIRRERVSLVVDLYHGHTVRERRDIQHVQERRLGRPDTRTSSDDLDVGHNFNGTTRDLGGDTEGLEEGRFAGLHSGVARRDNDVLGCERTRTGRGGDLVGDDNVPDFLEILGGEDESNVALDVGKEPLELGELAEDGAECTPDHGVLAHQDNAFTTEGLANLMHLIGTDVVDIDQEDGS
jgi:hypothetical protein